MAFGAGIMNCRDKADDSEQYYEDALGYSNSPERKKHQVRHIKHDTGSDYADAKYTEVNESIAVYFQCHGDLQAIDL